MQPAFDQTQFYNEDGDLVYTSASGPAENDLYCPWNGAHWLSWGSYRGDCWVKSKCKLNLRFFGRCNNEMFDQTFSKQVCKWNEALEILPMLNAEIEKLGANWEVHHEKTCINKKTFPDHYRSERPTSSVWQNDQVFNVVRDVKQCEPDAGVLPCNIVRFHDVKSPKDYLNRLDRIIKHVSKKCNAEWLRHVGMFYTRLQDAILCPTTNPDHNPALMGVIRSDHDPVDFEYATEDQMDEFYEQNYV
jgi:hypothetical protein